jgi:hypothetical protein
MPATAEVICVATGLLVTLKVTEVGPDATITLACNVAVAVLLLEKAMVF